LVDFENATVLEGGGWLPSYNRCLELLPRYAMALAALFS
jgi:hypothetical protein